MYTGVCMCVRCVCATVCARVCVRARECARVCACVYPRTSSINTHGHRCHLPCASAGWFRARPLTWAGGGPPQRGLLPPARSSRHSSSDRKVRPPPPHPSHTPVLSATWRVAGARARAARTHALADPRFPDTHAQAHARAHTHIRTHARNRCVAAAMPLPSRRAPRTTRAPHAGAHTHRARARAVSPQPSYCTYCHVSPMRLTSSLPY